MSYPSGWTPIDEHITTAGRDMTTGIYYKVVTDASSEAGSYTWFWNGSNEECAGMITAVRGLNSSLQHDVDSFTNSLNSVAPATPSITTSQDDAFVFTCVFSSASTTTTSFTEPGGVTEIVDITETNRNLAVGWFTQTTAGATGSQTWTAVDAATSDDWHCYTFSFNALLSTTPTASESIPIGLSDVSRGIAIGNIVASESVGLGLSEGAEIKVLQNATDTFPATLVDTTTTTANWSAGESLSLGVTEGTPIFLYTLEVNESLPIGLFDSDEGAVWTGLRRVRTGTLTVYQEEIDRTIRTRP
jgi:hypothetical protein